MCCEQEECHIAVFNSEEAVCYLKAAGALAAYHDVAADHVSSYTIERRIGASYVVSLFSAIRASCVVYTTVLSNTLLLLIHILRAFTPNNNGYFNSSIQINTRVHVTIEQIYVLENAMVSLLTGDYQGVELSPRECRNKRGVAYGFKDVAALNILKNGLSWW